MTSSRSSRRRSRILIGLGLLALVACGGGVASVDNASSSSSGSSGSNTSPTTGSTSNPTSSATTTTNPTTTSTTNAKIPKLHRAVAVPCDDKRSTKEPVGVPDAGPPDPNGYVSCYTNAECTNGKNGRCIGNGHDGWYCTYDACETDSQCSGGAGVCECEGGFRSDYNVCLKVGCQIDSDCKAGTTTGYCSPTLGNCGHYAKTSGYFCHTPKDECTNDDDCAATPQGQKPYCAYSETAGHWKCSTAECAG